jgi:hypothetical protein
VPSDDDHEEGMIMDSERFDGLVRSLGQTRSRRQTLRGLAGVLAAGVFALGGQEADAGKRFGGAFCTKGRQCKTGKCVGPSGAKTCSCSNKFPMCAVLDASCQSGTCVKTCTCPDDGNECTDDVCTANGDCTHPHKASGTSCTTCEASTCACQNGTCTAASCDVDCAGKVCGDPDGCGGSCGVAFAPCAGPENCCGRCSIAEGHCVIV